MASQGNKRQIDGVEHELYRHENDNDIAAQENACHAYREQNAAKNEMVTYRDHIFVLRSLYRLANTTAPTTATKRRIPVTSSTIM